MWKMIGALSLVMGGITVIFFGIYDTPKRIKKENFVDEISFKKHLKYQRLLDVLVGGTYFLTGILYYMNLIVPNKIGFIVPITYFANRIMEKKIHKKYKTL